MYSPRRLSSVSLGIAICGVLHFVTPTRAGIPGASDPKAFTTRDSQVQEYEFNRRTLVGEYEKVGHKDPRWDKQAENLLEIEAIYFTQGGLASKRRFSKHASVAELSAAADAAIAAGCDDPLVLDAVALAKRDHQARDEWHRWSIPSVDGLLDSRYPLCRKADAAHRSLALLDSNVDAMRIAQLQQVIFDLDVKICRQKDWQGLDRRWQYDIIHDDIDSWATPELQQFLVEMTAQPADDWMVAMCTGLAHLRMGWNARGGGYANSVTPEAMQKFSDEMNEAQKFLEAAENLHPDYPEAATEMMSVVQGQGGSAEEIRACFDRAVGAQLDFRLAYTSLIYSYLPRWMGSHEMMLEFGVECAATKRYDTGVPHMLVDAIASIQNDQRSWAFLDSDKVFQPLQEMYEGLIAKSDGEDRIRYASEFVGFAWQARKWDAGRKVLDLVGGKIDRAAVSGPSQVIADRAVSGIYALTGSHASAAKTAEAAAAAEQFLEAANEYDAIAKAADVDPRELLWLRGRAQELHWQEQFAAGDWVNITPDANLNGWYIQSGTFTSSGKELAGTIGDSGAMLICGFKPGVRWEIHGDFEIEKPESATAIGPDAGILFSVDGVNSYDSVLGRPFSTEYITHYRFNASDNVCQMNLDAQFPIDLRSFDGNREGRIASNLVAEMAPTLYPGLNPDQRLAIGSTPCQPGGRFKVRDLKIRLLTAPFK